MNKFLRLSLTKRLYLLLILTAAVIFSAFFVGTWWTESQSLETMLEQNGRSLSIGLEQGISLGMQLDEPGFVSDGAASVANIPNVMSVDVYDKHGKRMVLLGTDHPELSLAQLGKVKQGGLLFELRAGSTVERVIAPVHANKGALVGYSVLDLSRATVNHALETELLISALISLCLLLLFWWLTWLAVRQLQLPLDELDQAVDAVTQGRLDVSVNASIPEPLSRIARGFNRMTLSLANEKQSLHVQSEALKKSERHFRQLFMHMPVAMYMADMDGKIRQCNPVMAKLFGYKSASAMLKNVKFMSEFYVDTQQRDILIAELMRVKNLVGREVQLQSRQGDHLRCLLYARLVTDDEGHPKGTEGMIQDLTELKLLEQSLLQSQKMEVIGQLAGGVAHDFNNLLSVILGNEALLSKDMPHDSKSYHYAMRIRQAGTRAAELTGNLLGFARKGDMRSEPVLVVALLEEVMGLIKTTCDRRVQFSLDVSRDDLVVKGDPGQLHQVFMNLAVNATHAMPDGGEIVFKVTSQRGNVQIQVKDSGMGMDQKTMAHIFEPFFTTKETGKGTGLGLSMVYGIIEKMGGSISVDSEPGQGTTFEVILPLLGGVDLQTLTATTQITDVKMSGRVLLVDDEPMLREVGEEVLTRCGFDVTTAGSGEEALAMLASDRMNADIVLLDLNMPGIGGVETLRQIRQSDRYIKVIVLSGYSETTLDSKCHELRYDGFITKPYQFDKLCAEVSRVLGAAPAVDL